MRRSRVVSHQVNVVHKAAQGLDYRYTIFIPMAVYYSMSLVVNVLSVYFIHADWYLLVAYESCATTRVL